MYGLVLEGGGARGAFQIGAWKALRELGIEINGVSGTSVGALNGAMIVQGDFEKTYELWYNLSPSKVINVEDEMVEKLMNNDIKNDDISYFVQRLKELWHEGIDITPLKELLKENIDEEKIRNSGIDFGMVTIDLSDIKPLELYIQDIEEGMLIDYLIASSSLPVFKQERLDGKIFLDGGFYNNLPINLLSSRKYKDIIAVKLNKYDPILLKGIKNDLNITYIRPSEELGLILDFSQYRIRKNIKLGYFDTLKTFHHLKGNKYYIKSKGNESFFLDYFLDLDEAIVLEIGKIMGSPDIPFKRMLFEHIIPTLAELLGLQKNATYEDIVLAVFEEAAQRHEIERFKIYTFEDLEYEVLEKFNPSMEKFSQKIPAFLKQSDLVLKTFKNDILNEIIDEFIGNIASGTSV